jgi:hypothetical protein
MHGHGTDGLQIHVHNAPVGAPPIIPPDLLFGVDVTEIMRELSSKRATTEKALQDTVTPKNLLKSLRIF